MFQWKNGERTLTHLERRRVRFGLCVSRAQAAWHMDVGKFNEENEEEEAKKH